MLDYGAGIPPDMLLGHISWYSVSDNGVSHDHLTQLWTDSGLDPDLLPKAPRVGDAYKRACRKSERRGVIVPGTTHKANFMIRKVSNDADADERHLVVEVVDKNDKRLSYQDCAHLIWDKGEEKLIVKAIALPDDLDPLMKQTLHLFKEQFELASRTIDPQVIRLLIRSTLETMNAISLRRHGSLYFVPKKHSESMEGLVNVVNGLGGESQAHAIPMIDNKKQREMVRGALQDEIHKEATQKISELMTLETKGEKISEAKWANYRKDLDRLKATTEEYREFLESELTKADMEMKSLQGKLTAFLTEDLVKTKGD